MHGAQFALTEARIVLATLAARFRPALVNGHDPRPAPSITLRSAGGMPMTVSQRERAASGAG